jgi:hypothetical protein
MLSAEELEPRLGDPTDISRRRIATFSPENEGK